MCVTAATSCEIKDLTNGTTYTITVRAENESGFGPYSEASNPVTPEPTPATMVITGFRGTGNQTRTVFVDGATTGLVGATVTPWVKLAGETDYTPGTGTRTVGDDGTCTWQRRTGKKTYVYFVSDTGVRSDRVIIDARS